MCRISFSIPTNPAKRIKRKSLKYKKGNDDLTKAVNEVVKGLKDSGQVDKWFDEYIELSNKEAMK